MRTAQGSLASILAASPNVFMIANLYTFETTGSPVLLTSWPTDLGSFVAAGTVVTPGNYRSLLGLEDPTLQLTVSVDDSQASLLAAASNGAFDGQNFKAERVYMTTPGEMTNRVVQFTGIIIDVRPSSSEIQFTIGTVVGLLQKQNIGRPYQAQCPWVFGSPACGHTRQAGEFCNKTRDKEVYDGTHSCWHWGRLSSFGGFPDAPTPVQAKVK